MRYGVDGNLILKTIKVKCPFCGAPKERCHAQSPSLGQSKWRVICDDCGAEGPPKDDEYHCIIEWNERWL